LDWFDTNGVDELADRLAGDLVKRVPPSDLYAQGKKAAARRDKTRDAIFRQVRDFTSKHRLNIYKKAHLANRFKWALKEAGYPQALVDEMAFELARLMATARIGSV
jgi:hypothetical protein